MRLLSALLGITVVLVVMAVAIPVLWPIAANSTAINAMTGTDSGTSVIKQFWPIILLVIGLGLAVGLIYMGLRQFGIIGGDHVGAYLPLPIALTGIYSEKLAIMLLLYTGVAIGVCLCVSQIRKLKKFYATKLLT